jgi:hypothetical protein
MTDTTFSVGLLPIALLIFLLQVVCSWCYFEAYEYLYGLSKPGLAHLCKISLCSSVATAAVLLKLQQRVATNRWAYGATEKILQPILRVIIRDRRIQPAWNAAVSAQHVRTDDMHGLTKFVQHNGDALARAHFFGSPAAHQSFVAAARRLLALRNKAGHNSSGSFITNADIEQNFADAQAVVSLIGSRPRAPVHSPTSLAEVWNLIKDPGLRACGYRVGRYERAKRSLNKIQSQWESERSLTRTR